MGIPSGFSRNHIALHGTVSWNHILDNAGQYMANVGLSVGSRRSVIKHIRRSLFPALNTFFKDIFIFPKLFDFFLSLYKIHVCRYFLIHDASSNQL